MEKCHGLVGWLFLVLRPIETVFQSIAGRLPKRGRKRRERTDENKRAIVALNRSPELVGWLVLGLTAL